MTIEASHLTINVSNLDASISFYESIGFNLINRWGDHYAQLKAPGIEIGLHPAGADNLKDNSGNLSIGFTSDDLEETTDFLHKLAIKTTVRQEVGGQFVHFTDPDGTALYFIKTQW